MIKQYVTYEIAEKLKDLGFDEPCIFSYDRIPMICTMVDDPFHPLNYNAKSGGGYTSAPLCQQVTQWLREKHSIDIDINRGGVRDDWYLGFRKFGYGYQKSDKTYKSYDEALEAGFIIILKDHVK